ncbi:hypothetical protein UY3_03405 [Chelonia mydas]|uniref:Myb/SANT-like DNA-binding domain-containing protein n=1 Tax=Chelonia mydas TaxID=8469 RepID=M7C4J3_CHEMY|nr:hypothetical protein UY3_03405 [Chelonia mydas]
MPPCTRQAPVWRKGEVLDLISVWGEEAVQSQLCCSRRNYNTFGQISSDMMERGNDREAQQCRVKVKELRNAYCKARAANSHSSAAPVTCHFYKKLNMILEGRPISTLSTTMDTSEPSSTWQKEEEEEQSGSKGAEVEEDTPESLDAHSQELFSSQEEDDAEDVGPFGYKLLKILMHSFSKCKEFAMASSSKIPPLSLM